MTGIGAKNKPLKRDWSLAHQKIAAEGHRCRACRRPGGDFRIEAAHIIGREHDREPAIRVAVLDGKMVEVERTLVVHPDRIVPLCGPSTDYRTCHGKAHRGELDWLTFLTLPEQLQAVADAGSLTRALAKLSPEHNPRRIA